ncbi:MAG: tetratricopeptide repeat protein [Proteobacteria bacterium]|nr:tetratricopeptide repeat protein [Pseudomonadota bacterium]MDA1357320.1 tetratricopeptide repeat protein [Pseudomonadota bacterium]
MIRVIALIGLTVALMVGRMSMAAQDDPRLNELFAELKSAQTMSDVVGIEAQIWHLWSLSNDAAIDRILGSGIAAMDQGQFDAALTSFNTVIEMRPDFAEGWNKRATLYFLTGEYERSIADVERTLALEPRHFGALSGLGLINLALERPGKAMAAFEAALAVHPHMQHAKSMIERLRPILERSTI